MLKNNVRAFLGSVDFRKCQKQLLKVLTKIGQTSTYSRRCTRTR
jgi:hypothetical protein